MTLPISTLWRPERTTSVDFLKSPLSRLKCSHEEQSKKTPKLHVGRRKVKGYF